jgi:hypothetical protein
VRVLWSAICLGGLLVRCVGEAGEYQWRFYDQYTSAKKHRQALTELRSRIVPVGGVCRPGGT